ncbi:MAG TPA: hypothetical protein VGM19_14565 [Armatimonadota bacterium]
MNLNHIVDRIKDARAEVLLVSETHRMPEEIHQELILADQHLQNALELLGSVTFNEEQYSGAQTSDPQAE